MSHGTHGDHGGQLFEYAVVFALVAALVAVVASVFPGVGSYLAAHVSSAVCKAFGGLDCEVDDALGESASDDGDSQDSAAGEETGGGGTSGGGSEEGEGGGSTDSSDEKKPLNILKGENDFRPALCQTESETQISRGRVQAIAFQERETVVTEIQRADGSVWFVAQPMNETTGVGGSASASISIPLGPITIGVGGMIDGEVGLESNNTQIWIFEEDQQEEAEEFGRELYEQAAVGDNLFATAVSMIDRYLNGDEPLDLGQPDMEVEQESVVGSISVSSTLSAQLLKEGIGISTRLSSVGAEGALTQGVRTDHEGTLYDLGEPVISEINQVSGSLEGEVIVIGGRGGASAEWVAGIRADRTEDGDLQGIFLESSFTPALHGRLQAPFGVTAGPFAFTNDSAWEAQIGQAQNTSVWIGFDNDEQREIGEKFLSEYYGMDGAFNYFWETALGDHGFITEDPGPDGDPWEHLLYDQATVWQTEGAYDASSQTLGGSVSLGVSDPISLGGGALAPTIIPTFWMPFGASATTAESGQYTYDAWYLDAPENGERQRVAYDDCAPYDEWDFRPSSDGELTPPWDLPDTISMPPVPDDNPFGLPRLPSPGDYLPGLGDIAERLPSREEVEGVLEYVVPW